MVKFNEMKLTKELSSKQKKIHREHGYIKEKK